MCLFSQRKRTKHHSSSGLFGLLLYWTVEDEVEPVNSEFRVTVPARRHLVRAWYREDTYGSFLRGKAEQLAVGPSGPSIWHGQLDQWWELQTNLLIVS